MVWPIDLKTAVNPSLHAVPHKNVVVLELDLRITPVLFYLCACSSTVNSEWDALDIVNTLTL